MLKSLYTRQRTFAVIDMESEEQIYYVSCIPRFRSDKKWRRGIHYRITNSMGTHVEILNYGCIVKSIWVPDSKGELRNICIGLIR
jgi:hypothetical protein